MAKGEAQRERIDADLHPYCNCQKDQGLIAVRGRCPTGRVAGRGVVVSALYSPKFIEKWSSEIGFHDRFRPTLEQSPDTPNRCIRPGAHLLPRPS